VSEPYVLVDTNAFIHLTRSRERAERLRQYVENSRIVISFVTVAELRLGAHIRNYSEDSCRRMESEIAACVVVPPTDELSQQWARLVSAARGMSPGHPLGQPAQAHDAWIAATSRLFDLPMLTEDSDFAGLPGLRLILRS
jgi:tRNA(fMet)-specific endonuclease VapC